MIPKMLKLLRFCLFLSFAAAFGSLLLSYKFGISKSFVQLAILPFRAAEPDNSTIGYKFCYKKSSTTIVFLHLTTVSDEWIPLQACVFKRAAVLNPDAGVCVLTKLTMKPHPKLSSLPNLEFAQLDARYVFNGTPISSWYDDYVLNATTTSPHKMIEFSDGLRYGYLFNFGGKYLDTDMVVLRNLGQLRNAIGKENEAIFINSGLFFDQGHPFIKTVLDQFLQNFRPGVWGSVGPKLIKMVHQSGSVNHSSYRVLESRLLFPIAFTEFRLPFSGKDTDKEKVKSLIKDAFMFHLHRTISKYAGMLGYWSKNELPAGSFLEELCA